MSSVDQIIDEMNEIFKVTNNLQRIVEEKDNLVVYYTGDRGLLKKKMIPKSKL